jgi:hypothetical protein
MSLINDALKRARQAHTDNPTPAPDLPLRAAEPSHRPATGLPVLPLAVLLIALMLGGGLILLALKSRDNPAKVVHATEVEPSLPSGPTATPANHPGSQPPTIAVNTPVAAASQTDLPATTLAASLALSEPEPSTGPLPKLQGIFYHPSRPSAVINGRTVYVGSRVGDARGSVVLEIGPDSVTVGSRSQTNLLVLGE